MCIWMWNRVEQSETCDSYTTALSKRTLFKDPFLSKKEQRETRETRVIREALYPLSQLHNEPLD